jgi:hypothetical protein
MKKINFTSSMLLASFFCTAQTFPVTFEAPKLSKADTFWNGSDGSGGFKSNGITFRNVYDTTYKVWSGFGISNMKDSVTPGYGNQYSSYNGGAFQMTSQYGVVSGNAWMVFDSPTVISGMRVTNSTYTALDIKNGSSFSKKFGGISGDDPDYFLLKTYGYSGGIRVDSSKIYLVDYRFSDNSQDFILNEWLWIDMASWKSTDSIYFDYESSDVGSFGINTPLFFCLDDVNGLRHLKARPFNNSNFDEFTLDSLGYWNGVQNETAFISDNVIFENDYNHDWNSWSGWAVSNHSDTITRGFSNQYSAITGKGFDGKRNYIVGNYKARTRLPYYSLASNCWGSNVSVVVTNSVYSYFAMKDGDQFSKKFGGPTGNDPDWLKLIIKGYDQSGNMVDSIAFFLADFRFLDNNQDYIVRNWTPVNLTELAVTFEFTMESSDTSSFGMNTPAYFCLGNFLYNCGASIEGISKHRMTAYPNPTSDFISFKNIEGIGQIQILSLDGRIVFEKEMSKEDRLYVGDFSPGMYIVRVEQDHTIMQTKFIKQ